ncbi:helix-turn-helix domain-containing protein [Flavobacterium sp. IMCC34518]|uniref:helix-turn-helix domain-containing protein n=1 Tax=Flavobacterium sp. IMCC34518 TaxID=3003623 RepID=UPI002482B7DF|nr:helix-turn-helix domain-containing protein [Flavobacterium sp. IMCC34518]
MNNFEELSFEKLPAAVSKILLDLEDIRKLLLRKHTREPTDNEILSLEKALAFLLDNGCAMSKSKIYKLTSKQRIPHAKLSNKLIFSKHELAQWLELQTAKNPNTQTESIINSAIILSKKNYKHGKR